MIISLSKAFCKHIGATAVVGLLLWVWAGGSPQARCAATCCVLVPFAAGGVCCLAAGCVLWRSKKQGINNHSLLPLLAGATVGPIVACLVASPLCHTFCRLYGINMCLWPTQPLVSGPVFAAIASFLVCLFVFGSDRRSSQTA